MAWHLTADVDEFENAAGEFLRADPVRNSVLLTVAAALRTSGATAYGDVAPYFGWYAESDVKAVFLRTPPMPAIMTNAPERAVRELVEVLDGVPGINGPAGAVQRFAEAWDTVTGRSASVVSNRRLFRLADLRPPQPSPPGRARLVAEGDRELLVEWFAAFAADIGEEPANAVRGVDRRLANGELLLWEADGVPVSLAGATTPIAGVTRIGPVYTPAALRGRGYAGAVTSAVSQRGLDAGHQVILFTDMANPTSNALYQRLGFRAIGRWSELKLN